MREVEHVDPVAIGDRVRYVEAGQGSGMIVEILPRNSRLSRPAPVPGQRVFEQVIVSNADLVIPSFRSPVPPPSGDSSTATWSLPKPPVCQSLIVITKLDLAWKNPQLEEELEVYRRIGYPVQMVSAATGEGIEELKSAAARQNFRAGWKIRRGEDIPAERHPAGLGLARQSSQPG